MGSNPIGHPTLPPPRKWQAPRLPRQATPSQRFAAAQEAALAQIAANRAGVLESEDPEYLHQLRVGLRRLRSALRAFHCLLPGKRTRRLARRTRRAMRKLGRARDWDVLVAWLEGERAPQALILAARRQRAAARASARRALSDLDLPRVEARPSRLDPAAVLERLERKAREQAGDDAQARHKLRIRVKRLRYASEVFGRRRSDLEALQEVLGELNDIAVGRRLLRRLDAETPALYRALDARERRLLSGLERMKTSSLGQRSGRRG